MGSGFARLGNAFEELGNELETLREHLEGLQEGLDVITLGGDLRQYMRFRQLSPHVVMVASGEMRVFEGENWQPSKEDSIEVLSFVFDTILRWQELPLEHN